jgi:hypothetical protein
MLWPGCGQYINDTSNCSRLSKETMVDYQILLANIMMFVRKMVFYSTNFCIPHT